MRTIGVYPFSLKAVNDPKSMVVVFLSTKESCRGGRQQVIFLTLTRLQISGSLQTLAGAGRTIEPGDSEQLLLLLFEKKGLLKASIQCSRSFRNAADSDVDDYVTLLLQAKELAEPGIDMLGIWRSRRIAKRNSLGPLPWLRKHSGGPAIYESFRRHLGFWQC
jgi:hypothetical protein